MLKGRAGLTSRQLTRFLAKIQRGTGCWEWVGGRYPKGYGMFNAGRWPDGRQDTRYAHRVVWELLNGKISTGLSVCHHCDNPPCCNPAHLFIGTHTDNIRDMYAKGRQATVRPGAWSIREPLRSELLNGNYGRGELVAVCRSYGVSYRAVMTMRRRAREKRLHGRKVAA